MDYHVAPVSFIACAQNSPTWSGVQADALGALASKSKGSAGVQQMWGKTYYEITHESSIISYPFIYDFLKETLLRTWCAQSSYCQAGRKLVSAGWSNGGAGGSTAKRRNLVILNKGVVRNVFNKRPFRCSEWYQFLDELVMNPRQTLDSSQCWGQRPTKSRGLAAGKPRGQDNPELRWKRHPSEWHIVSFFFLVPVYVASRLWKSVVSAL